MSFAGKGITGQGDELGRFDPVNGVQSTCTSAAHN